MVGEYGQFCPVAKAAEVLDQRWTLLVVRELVAGSTRFNDIHRGLPRMSRSLLSTRLKSLVRHGLVERLEDADGPTYRLSAAGQELHEVVEVVGAWGVRWMSSLGEQDLDPALLVWDMHRRIDLDRLPDGRTVVELDFVDVAATGLRHWWLVCDRGEVTICDADPGFGVDVALRAPIRTMVEVWMGEVDWDEARRDRGLDVAGLPRVRAQVPDWLRLNSFADVPRPVRAPARRS